MEEKINVFIIINGKWLGLFFEKVFIGELE